MKDYILRFNCVDMYVNDKILSDLEKRRLINCIYHPSKIKEFVFMLGTIQLSKIPYIMSNSLLKKEQAKDIKDLFAERKNLIFNSMVRKLAKGERVYSWKIEDLERNICISVDVNSDDGLFLFHQMIYVYDESVLVNQYNVSLLKVKDEVVIDAGSNLGEFAMYCARLGAKRVFAFEPVAETFELLRKQITLNNLENVVIPIHMALGDYNGVVNICSSFSGDGSASINNDNKKFIVGYDRHESNEVEIIRLDDFCSQREIESVGFIKIDVEGYEENVLRGAYWVIKIDKPILSFSAYHKPTDKIVLPDVVRSIRPDYDIILLNRKEEDFYCD